MAKVFVSYSRKDIEFAKKLTGELQKSELDFWIDWEGIPPTVDWWQEIEKGIEESDAFLFLISPESIRSKVCGQEIEAAIKNGKRIIPIVVREIEWQDTPPQLGHLNYIFFSRDDDFKTAIRKLMTAIQTDYEWAATHRRLQVKALEWERNSNEKSFLLRGKDLQEAEFQLATNTSKEPHPTNLQREFVFESRKATDRQRRTTTSIAIGGVVILAILAVVAVVMAVKATQLANISRAGELSAQSIELRERDPKLSLLLGIESYRSAHTAEARKALLADAADGSLIQFFILPKKTEDLIAISPDGRTFAIANQDYSINLWDALTRQEIGDLLIGHHGRISAISFSPKGDILVSGGCTTPENNFPCPESEIIVWQIEKQHIVKKTIYVHEGISEKLVFSPDGALLALLETVPTDGYPWSIDTITFWNMDSYQQSRQPLKPDSGVIGMAISPDKHTLALYTFSSLVRLWNIETQELKELPIDADGADGILFSPDGNTIITTDWNDYSPIIFWDIYMQKERNPDKVFLSYDGAVDSLALSPDGKILATALFIPSDSGVENVGEITLWDVETLKPLGKHLIGHKTKILHLFFSQDGRTLTSISEDNTGVLWDIPNALGERKKLGALSQFLFKTTDNYSSENTQISFEANGKILVASFTNKITLWDVKTRSPEPQNISGDDFEFSNDGSMVATIKGTEITLRNLQDNSSIVIHPKKDNFQPEKSRLILSSDGKTLISFHILSYNPIQNEIIFWDISKEFGINPQLSQPVGIPFTGDLNGLEIYSIALSPDGKIFATATLDSKIILWDLRTHKRITVLQSGQTDRENNNPISRLEFSTDGKLLAAQYDGFISNYIPIKKEVILWDLDDYLPLGLPFNATSFALSEDGSTLATTALDIIVLWDIKTHQPIGKFEGLVTDPPTSIAGLAFSPDGNTLATISSGSGSIVLWDLNPLSWINQACQQAGRNFTNTEWAQYFPGEEYRKTCEQWPPDSEATPTSIP